MTAYWEKLRDPRWQKKRLEIMEDRQWTCEMCEATEKTLNVHHTIYRKGADPWDYADHEYRCLCESCHEIEHGWRRHLDEAIALMDPGRIEELVGFAEAIVATDAVFTDEDAQQRSTTWPIRSHEHAFGFLARMRGVNPRHIDFAVEKRQLTFDELVQLQEAVFRWRESDR